MLAYFRPLISKFQSNPENAVLSEKLKNAARECDLWRGLYLEEKRTKEILSAELKQETTRNRLREDDLINNTLRHFKLPFPRFREETEVVDREEATTVQNEDEYLAARAVDYLEQTYGENYSSEQYEETLKTMKANPTYWLSN